MNKLSHHLLKHAVDLAREAGAQAVFLDATAVERDADWNDLFAQGWSAELMLVLLAPAEVVRPASEHVRVLRLPDVPLTRLTQIKIGMVLGVAEKIVERNDVVVCVTGTQHSGRLDMVTVLRVGDEPEFFVTNELNPLPPDVQPAVFERLLTVASELAAEGREQRPVGAIFVVGDSDKVLENSRQLVLNPFKGYSEEERNILSGDLDETIKEFSAIDGAFVFRGDGVILSAGRYLVPKGKPAEPLRPGLGARHEAAAAITAVTDAVAIAVSQSTSTITIYNSGRTMMEVERHRRKDGRDGE